MSITNRDHLFKNASRSPALPAFAYAQAGDVTQVMTAVPIVEAKRPIQTNLP